MPAFGFLILILVLKISSSSGGAQRVALLPGKGRGGGPTSAFLEACLVWGGLLGWGSCLKVGRWRSVWGSYLSPSGPRAEREGFGATAGAWVVEEGGPVLCPSSGGGPYFPSMRGALWRERAAQGWGSPRSRGCSEELSSPKYRQGTVLLSVFGACLCHACFPGLLPPSTPWTCG